MRKTLQDRVLTIRRALEPHLQPAVEEALAVIEEQFPREASHEYAGAAIFVRGGSDPFQLSLRFRVPLPTWIAVDRFPSIYHLVELKDTYHRYVIMLCSEKSVRLLEVNLGEVTRDLWQERPELRKRVGHEWSRQHYQDHRRERTNHFFSEAIAALEKRMVAGGYTHLILAGQPHITAQVRNRLPAHLAEHLIDTVSAPNNHRLHDVVASTLSVFIEEEQRESISVADRLLRELRKNGLAVAGADASMQALKRKQADVLVLAKEATVDGREEMVRIAESYGCLVEVVEQSAALLELGGAGCLLRYKDHPGASAEPRPQPLAKAIG